MRKKAAKPYPVGEPKAAAAPAGPTCTNGRKGLYPWCRFEALEVRLAARVLGVPSEHGTPDAGSSMVKLLVRERDEFKLLLAWGCGTCCGDGSLGERMALPKKRGYKSV